ncbi:MAG: GNAT family N-acetyltransferase [Actinomycetota bacterium]|nr:GNAT family N-acetyltransferase [Actinomycetota bacterium]
MIESVEVHVVDKVAIDELTDLYGAVGWVIYTAAPAKLETAVTNSSHVVVARAGGQLIGLARGMSDDVSIFYLQDILVRPEWQHQGIGRRLLKNCLERFSHVRQKVLLTDGETAQHRFYESMGYRDIGRVANVNLHAFVRIEGLEMVTDPPRT